MAAKDDYLIDFLVEMGSVDPVQLAQIREEAEGKGDGLVDTLVAKKVITPEAVAQAKAGHFGHEFVSLASQRLSDEVIALVPRHVAKRYRAIPVAKNGSTVSIAVSDPSDLDMADSIQRMVRGDVTWCVATDADIDNALKRYYGGDDEPGKVIQDITEGEVAVKARTAKKKLEDSKAGAADVDAPIIKLVNQIIVEAFKMRASDIHLEPLAKNFRLRYRIDGVLMEMKGPPKQLQSSVIARLKIMSNMSISERRIPAY